MRRSIEKGLQTNNVIARAELEPIALRTDHRKTHTRIVRRRVETHLQLEEIRKAVKVRVGHARVRA